MTQRAVITGLGIIAPNGIGKERYWKAICSGKSGIKRITGFDTSGYPCKVGGEITEFDPAQYLEKKKARILSRFAQFALVATSMAMEDAGASIADEDPYRIGIAFGNTVGGKDVEEKQRKYHECRSHAVNPFSASLINSNFAVGVIAAEFGIRGPNLNFSTGCTSALNAIAYATELIKQGQADMVIAGGSEAPLVPFVFDAFCVTGSLSKQAEKPESASRPFDKHRDGYVLAEGCAIVVMETLEHARKRKAGVYAEISGYGVTNDAYSLIRMEPTGKEAAQAIKRALANSGTAARDINYINAHGSSSLLSDKRETNAIKDVFGETAYTVPISAVKSMIGQSLGANGGFQVATTALAIRNQCIPPTINYEERDPECDLDYTPNTSRAAEIRAGLINSFGLGGNNISMVLKKVANA
jgi:beta-ketoacyl-acyl-carrier-protein synthase II